MNYGNEPVLSFLYVGRASLHCGCRETVPLVFSQVTHFQQSLIFTMLTFSSFFVTALLGAIGSNAAPLIQERGMLLV